MTRVTAHHGSLARRELLRSSVRHRVSSLVLVGSTWVAVAVSIAVHGPQVHGPRPVLLLVVGAVVVGAAVLWGAWRPAVFVEDDQLVIRNLFHQRALSREVVRGFRIARRDSRTMSVWAVTSHGAVAINAAERPRFMPGVRDLDADVAALNTWLHKSDNQTTPSVSYLPDTHHKRPQTPDDHDPSSGRSH
jgi:hypothetical protein